ncbi:dual specificity phosphatase 12 [Podila horticola]|nr:dual specificity phosphatase 12 [Podila horticola]
MTLQMLFPGNMMREMQEILPGLYLSGATPAESLAYLQEMGITHIIQVTDINTPRFPGEFMYKLICVPDMEETNLIKHFPDTFKFISEALAKEGKVLVHCAAGASRSVTVICAYLMKTQNMSAADALSHVQALRPIAGPNDGFMTQLNLYGDIEYDVDVSRTAYRRFLIASMAAQREMYGYIEDMTLAADPLNAGARLSPSGPSTHPNPSAILASASQRPLKCKKCRQGQSSFEYRKRDGTLNVTEAIHTDISKINPVASTVCQSYFIEPVEWIQELHGLEGKISCPKCDSKLGTFNWSGEQCSCGTWVTPAFMMHKGKVDG